MATGAWYQLPLSGPRAAPAPGVSGGVLSTLTRTDLSSSIAPSIAWHRSVAPLVSPLRVIFVSPVTGHDVVPTSVAAGSTLKVTVTGLVYQALSPIEPATPTETTSALAAAGHAARHASATPSSRRISPTGPCA